MTICKFSELLSFHFVTLCIETPLFRYKSSFVLLVCAYTKPLTYIKRRTRLHFSRKNFCGLAELPYLCAIKNKCDKNGK